MLNDFKEDTEFIIAKLLTEGKIASDEVDELCIIDCEGSYYEHNKRYTQIGGKINWDAMLDCFGRENWEYDAGFGLETFMGWITFKNSNTWLQRKEYDGSEWWESVTKPNLHDNNLR